MRLPIFIAAATLTLWQVPAHAEPLKIPTGSNAATSYEDWVRQGRAAFLAGDPDQAEFAYRQACAVTAGNPHPLAREITCENLFASIDEARGNTVRAEELYARAVSDAERAGVAYLPVYCARLIDLGEYYRRHGKDESAEGSLLKATALARRLPEYGELLPEALTRLGGYYAQSPQPERGRAPLTEALSLLAGNRASATPASQIAFARGALGMIDLVAGNFSAAEASLRQSVAIATTALGEDHPVTAGYQTNLALVLIAERQFAGAGLLLRRARYLVEKSRSPWEPQLAAIFSELSSVASGEGRPTDAEEYAQHALSLLQRQSESDPVRIASAQVALAAIFLRRHDLSAAEAILPDTVTDQRRMGIHAAALANSVQLLGDLRQQQHNWSAAEALYREAIALRKDTGADSPALLRSLAEAVKRRGGEKQEIRALEARARAVSHDPKQGTQSSVVFP